MSILRGILIGLCLTLQVTAQTNLVLNESFEEHDYCPYNVGISMVADWVGIRGSVDYFHECGTNGQSVPDNWAGSQEAHTGQAYIGMAVCASPWAISFPLLSNAREFAGVSLRRTLVAGEEYQVEFFINLSDIKCYAIRNMGAYLSNGQPSDQIDQLLSLQPQVRYEGEEFLDAKESWTRISGTFTAQGGENFLTIGNFDDDDHTDTLAVSCNNSGQLNAYYYVDDVSVISVDSLVGIEESRQTFFNIYPNPTIDHLIIETRKGISGKLRLIDAMGREMFSTVLQSSSESIDISMLPTGMYVAVLEQEGKGVARRKLLVE